MRNLNSGASVAIILLLVCQAAVAQAPPALQIQHRGAGPVSLPVGPSQPDWMAAHFINVGQGSATLFEFSCGLVLIDAGGQAEASTDWRRHFTSYLDQVFARRPELHGKIDVVYITHPHPDHTLGISDLISNAGYQIGAVVTDAQDGQGTGPARQRSLIRYANQHRIPQVQIKTSLITGVRGLTSRNIDPLRCSGGDPDIRVLWGSFDQPHHWGTDEEKDANNHSVAVRIAYGESSFFITGDMEEPAQRALIERYAANRGVLNTDVYVAGHHGSKNGTIEGLVRAMSPEIAIASAGDPSKEEAGQYTAFHHGHPNKAAIALLSNPTFGVTMRRPSVRVGVGVRGEAPRGRSPAEWEYQQIDHAIFSTGWDGDIVVLANRNGTKRVIID